MFRTSTENEQPTAPQPWQAKVTDHRYTHKPTYRGVEIGDTYEDLGKAVAAVQVATAELNGLGKFARRSTKRKPEQNVIMQELTWKL